MALTERDVQLVVDAMPVLEQRVAEIERNASAMQIVNQATVQTMRNELTESWNKVVDRASAKFANIELQALELHEPAKAVVDVAGQELHNNQVEDLRDDGRCRVCNIPTCGGPRKQGSHSGPSDFSDTSQGDRTEGSAHWRRAVREATARAPNGTLKEKTIPRTFEGELYQWRAWRVNSADFMDTRNVGMFNFFVRHRYEQGHAR